jgi:hypothetical protein
VVPAFDLRPLHACAHHGAPASPHRYVVPAYELRRVLALQRQSLEPFELQYTRMPSYLGKPTEWKSFVGPAVVYMENPTSRWHNSGAVECTERHLARGSTPSLKLDNGEGSACDAKEIVYLPPPSWWLTKMLHPYPIPLLDGAGDGIHCTT